MQEICPKMNAEILSNKMQKRSPTKLVTVHRACDGRRWQRCAATEGWWGSLTKCGVTKLVTVRRVYDSRSCRFVMKFREVIPIPIFQELKFFGTKTLDRPLCLWRSVILAVEGNEESSRRNCTSMGLRNQWRSVVTTTIRREVRRPSRVLTDFQQIESLFT